MDDFVFTVGGRAFRAGPMVFLCLQKAWPHYRRMVEADRAAADARTRVISQMGTDEDNEIVLDAMLASADAALEVIAAALSLSPEPENRPSASELRHLLRGEEMIGVITEATRLINVSVTGGQPMGKAEAATSTAIFSPSSSNSPHAASVGATHAPSNAA